MFMGVNLMTDLDRLREALKILEHGRQTHIDWIEYLETDNPDFDTQYVGDVDHHRWYMEAYDAVIPAARRFLHLAETGQRTWWCQETRITDGGRIEGSIPGSKAWFDCFVGDRERGPECGWVHVIPADYLTEE